MRNQLNEYPNATICDQCYREGQANGAEPVEPLEADVEGTCEDCDRAFLDETTRLHARYIVADVMPYQVETVLRDIATETAHRIHGGNIDAEKVDQQFEQLLAQIWIDASVDAFGEHNFNENIYETVIAHLYNKATS